MRRYIHKPATNGLAWAEQYLVSTNYNCKTSYLTKVQSRVPCFGSRLKPHQSVPPHTGQAHAVLYGVTSKVHGIGDELGTCTASTADAPTSHLQLHVTCCRSSNAWRLHRRVDDLVQMPDHGSRLLRIACCNPNSNPNRSHNAIAIPIPNPNPFTDCAGCQTAGIRQRHAVWLR